MENEKIKIRSTLNKIEKRVCDYFGIKEQDIVDKKRCGNIPLARKYIWYIAHNDYGISVGNIAKTYFRTERNVFFAVSRIKFLVNRQKWYRETYNNIVEKIKIKG